MLKPTILRTLFFVASFCFCPATAFATQQSPDAASGARPLAINSPVERELAGGQTHAYLLNLADRQIARVVANQRGIDVVVEVFAPDGVKVFEVDSPNGTRGDEAATVAAREAGVYRVEVRSLYNDAAPGRYQIRLDKFLTESDYSAERLAGLARLWGAVKFFHPYLAYKEIDWDRALLETIPQVKGARSSAEYHKAITHMLSFLNDPGTHIQTLQPAPGPGARNPGATDAAAPPVYFRSVEGVVVINVRANVGLMPNAAESNKVTSQIAAEAEKSKGVVFDCRGEQNGDMQPYYLNAFLRRALTTLTDQTFTFGTTRSRMHSGYAPQTGGTSGGYFSALVTAAPETLAGEKAPGTRKAITILTNEATPDVSALLGGLQAAGLANVVHQGAAPKDAGADSPPVALPDGVTVRVRMTELVNPDGSIGFEPDVLVPASTPATSGGDAALAIALKSVAQPAARREKKASTQNTIRGMKDEPYARMHFPDEAHRLLALFRYWNVINYFFPYKHLLGQPWDNVLTEFIPKFEANKDALEYQMTVAEMVARMQDSHGGVRNAAALEEYRGKFRPPVEVRSVGGQTVVTHLLDAAAAKAVNLNVGDIILAVDGETVEARAARLSRTLASSTPQWTRLVTHRFMLSGAENSKAKLRVKGADGNTREIEMVRGVAVNRSLNEPLRPSPVFGVLPNGYGYIDLARLTMADVDKAMDAVAKAPALIFDMRGYPNGTAWAIAPRLTSKEVTAALFQRPEYHSGSNSGDTDDSGLFFRQKVAPSGAEPYRGRVVMLINEHAISQAEHTCLFFEAATDVTFIGGPTAGANGDVTNMVLPGGLLVGFTGHDVRHGDGRRLQRLGIQPHVKVEPTARGIREGRDEVLEAAFDFLRRGGK